MNKKHRIVKLLHDSYKKEEKEAHDDLTRSIARLDHAVMMRKIFEKLMQETGVKL